MIKNSEKLTDYVGQWFKAYREIGEPYEIYFETETQNQSLRISVDHALHDGIGALYKIADHYSWKIRPSNDIKTPPPITKFRYLLNIFLFLYWTRNRKNIWPFKVLKAECDEFKTARIVFNKSETADLKKKAERLKISLNALLFHTINQTLTEVYSLPRRAWWMPVNMRPDLGLETSDPRHSKNYVSNFTLDFSPSFSLTETQNEIKKCLKQQRHWGTWWWQLIGRLTGYKPVNKIALKGLSNSYAGAFSNLGEWICSDSESNVSAYINTLQSHPLGVGVIVWNEKLNLTLRSYSGFPAQSEDLNQILKTWVHNLKN